MTENKSANQESWPLPEWIEQAKNVQEKETDWLLLIKKDGHKQIAVMDGEVFLEIFEELIRLRKKSNWGKK